MPDRVLGEELIQRRHVARAKSREPTPDDLDIVCRAHARSFPLSVRPGVPVPAPSPEPSNATPAGTTCPSTYSRRMLKGRDPVRARRPDADLGGHSMCRIVALRPRQRYRNELRPRQRLMVGASAPTAAGAGVPPALIAAESGECSRPHAD